jgi:hypothetical protein
MIGSKANMGSSFPVQFIVTNTSDFKIKSGMFGKVNMKSENQKSGIIIPASAIVGTSSQPQVYKVKNGKAVLSVITIAQKIKNKTVVSKGLEVGDVIITNGFINLFNNANLVKLLLTYPALLNTIILGLDNQVNPNILNLLGYYTNLTYDFAFNNSDAAYFLTITGINNMNNNLYDLLTPTPLSVYLDNTIIYPIITELPDVSVSISPL